MAVWQFDLFLVPRLGSAPTLDVDGWVLPLVPERAVNSARELLSSWLGEPWLMCEGIEVFGDETGNRIDISSGEAGGAEILARIDARAENLKFCRLLHELVSGTDCRLFSPEFGGEVGAGAEDLLKALMRSRAWSYALSPADALRRLADEH